MSKFNGKKTNNTNATNAKKKLRYRSLNSVSMSNVLELCCGDGVMYDNVWHNADSYLGVDIKKSSNKSMISIVQDAVVYIKKHDISMVTIFDIDTYGSPYKCLNAIINRLIKTYSSGNISFCVTDGIQMDLRMGNITDDMAILAGIRKMKLNGVYKIHDRLIKMIINNISALLNAEIAAYAIYKGKTGSGMRYYFFTLKKD